MAKGYDRHQARKDAVVLLGRNLVRRCSSKCEICEAGGVALAPLEIKPLPEEPNIEHAIMICETCRHGVEGKTLDPVRWRFLESVVWNEIPAVQVTAVRLCRRLAADNCTWVNSLLENLYLAPEIEEWLDSK